MFSKPTAFINLHHLQHNAIVAKQHAPNCKLMAVVKANAYGHGVQEVVKTLTINNIADGFAVARFDEALELRRIEGTKPILILGGAYTNNELDSCLKHSIDVVIHQTEQIELLYKHKTTRDNKIVVWLKIDTGMHRLGILPAQLKASFDKISAIAFVKKVIVMTHFSSADDINNIETNNQITTFNKALITLPEKKIETSLANSAAILHWTDKIAPIVEQSWVRPGLMLYGINPVPNREINLKPVMTLQAPIVSMRTIPAGEYVGYNQAWRATRESKIATVALGYGDGYPTQIKTNTPVLIHGKRAPIVGRVSMDLITVDCTEIEKVKTGDAVIFWGEDSFGNQLPVEEIAKQAQTIPYDLVTRISGRVKYSY